MKPRKIFLFLFVLVDLIAFILFVYYAVYSARFHMDLRLIGGILTCIIAIVTCLIVMMFLFKSEEYVKKVNVSNRYKELSPLEFEKYGIDSEEYKKMVYEKFKLVHEAFSNLDLDVLKANLTFDLYDYYIEQLEVFKLLNRRYIMSDFELIEVKIYEIDDSVGDINIKAYLNVKLYDYMIDLETLKCVYGSDKRKKDLEFEIDIEKRNMINGLYKQYVISRKYCINDMDDVKIKNKIIK